MFFYGVTQLSIVIQLLFRLHLECRIFQNKMLHVYPTSEFKGFLRWWQVCLDLIQRRTDDVLNIKVSVLLNAGPWQFKYFINEQKIIILSQSSAPYLIRYASVILIMSLDL